MKRIWPKNKASETGEEIQTEVRKISERSSRIQSKRLENIIITLKKV
jgi:hypothetical protein